MRTSKQIASSALHALPESLKGLLYRVAWHGMTEQHRDDLRVTHQMASMEWSLRNIKSLGFLPRNIIDVGAYHGDWTRMIKAIFPEAHVLMVEAQTSKEAILKQVVAEYPGKVSCSIGLLGPEKRESVPFYELETGSSVLPEQSDIKRAIVHHSMQTLDQMVSEKLKGPCDLLKLDVQGFEIEVLKGATDTLKNVEIVLMEVSLLGVNKGSPLLHEAVQYMTQRGFLPYDICSFTRRPLDNALWQTDFIFVKDSSSLVANQTFGR